MNPTVYDATQKPNMDQSRELDVLIHTLARLSLTRLGGGSNHISRIENYMTMLAETLRPNPRFADFLKHDDTVNALAKVASLHDIGNAGIPDRILLKPGKLNSDEFDVIKIHSKIGFDAIIQAEQELAGTAPALTFAKEIILNHHERWNGSGYPEGKFGDDIPISARLFMVVDVYDALISRRVYKPQMNHQEAIKVIAEGRDTLFDPDVVDAFLHINEKFNKIAYLYADNDADFKKMVDYLEIAIGVEP